MKKYAHVQDLLGRLTDDKTFRTFFTLYLMAESDEEREVLNERFWREASKLPASEQALLRAELTRCFLRLPILSAALMDRAVLSAA